jgi:hypothetical protein
MAKKSGKQLADIAKNMVLGSFAGKKKLVKTVDATPDWVGLIPLFMDWIQNGNPKQYEEAQRNLMQMARISDSYRKNKSLFEASPDMYEACKLALKGFTQLLKHEHGEGDNQNHFTIALKQAIEKAEGK